MKKRKNKTKDPKSRNAPDIPDFWLANKIFHNNLCIFIIISALLYLLLLPSLHKSLVYPPFVDILNTECSEDVRGEYSSAKYQWRNRGDTLSAIATLSREKLRFLKEYKNEIISLVLPHFNFFPAIEKWYYVSISTGCQNNS